MKVVDQIVGFVEGAIDPDEFEKFLYANVESFESSLNGGIPDSPSYWSDDVFTFVLSQNYKNKSGCDNAKICLSEWLDYKQIKYVNSTIESDDDDVDDIDEIEYVHPKLGEMFMDTDNSWTTTDIDDDSLAPITSIQLVGGPSGPNDESIAFLDKILGQWIEILTEAGVHSEIARYMNSYGVYDVDIWDSVTMAHFTIESEMRYTTTFKFSWQSTGDGHHISIDINDGVCEKCQING